MRILKSGDIEIRIRANLLALLYFQQEFDDEIMSATTVLATKIIATQNLLEGKAALFGLDTLDMAAYDFEALNWASIVAPGVDILRLCWAMAKAQAKSEGTTLEKFEAWLDKVEGAKMRDLQVGVFLEAVEGFFRSNAVR